MPRKLRSTREGRNFLRGERFDVSRRGIRAQDEGIPRERIMLPDGTLLNMEESVVYRALKGMNVPFQSQVWLGNGGELGSALVDFLITYPPIALEYQGPWHDSSEGQARDFFRRAAREQAGYRVEYIYKTDLKRIHQRLREILGWAA